MEMVPEFVRITYVNASGKLNVVDVDITGPVIEAEKSLHWASAQIQKDGGKVTHVQFGSKDQWGTFRERVARKIPLFQGGFRRMAAYLHP